MTALVAVALALAALRALGPKRALVALAAAAGLAVAVAVARGDGPELLTAAVIIAAGAAAGTGGILLALQPLVVVTAGPRLTERTSS